MSSGTWIGWGYALSIASVVLLALVAWESVAEKPVMQSALIGGALLSILGIAARWIAHIKDAEKIEDLEDEVD